MSAPWRAAARAGSVGPRARALALISLLPLLASLLVHAASAADPSPAARRVDAAQARREGVALDLVRHQVRTATMIEVRPVDPAARAPYLLDVAGQAGSAAVADGMGRGIGMLVLARADGSQLQVRVEGLLDATFAPDDGWLAVVDGAGRLWRLGAVDGAMRPLADGPFLQAPLVEADGSVLALAVSSVEAPFRSQLVRVKPDGSVGRISDESLVYDAQRLADGSLAVVAHRPGTTVVRRIAGGSEANHLDLGADAVNVSISSDGDVVAWETDGLAFVKAAGQEARSLGRGSRLTVSPDGEGILLARDGATVYVDLAGAEIATLPDAIALLDCGECGS